MTKILLFGHVCLLLCDLVLFPGCDSFRPRQGYRPAPGWVPYEPPKHIPQRYKDRYEAREKLWEYHKDLRSVAKRFTDGYSNLVLTDSNLIAGDFVNGLIGSRYTKKPLCAKVPGFTFYVHSVDIPDAANFSKRMISGCLNNPLSKMCKSKLFMHLHETPQMMDDPNYYYNVRTAYFPFGRTHDMMRVVRVDLTFLGASKGLEKVNSDDICNLFVQQNPVLNSTWDPESVEEYMRIDGDPVPIFGLPHEYSDDMYKFINFVLESGEDCISVRVTEVVGEREPGNPEIRFKIAPSAMQYFREVER